MSPRRRPLALALLFLDTAGGASAHPSGKPAYGTWGVDYATMDRAVKPGDDFFDYAEGSWVRTAPIAPDKAGAGYNYDLPDQAELDVRAIAQDADRHPTTLQARQIADLYGAWMDERGIEARGLRPLRPYLERIAAVSTCDQLVELMAQPGYASPVEIDIEADEKDPTRYTVGAARARLGLAGQAEGGGSAGPAPLRPSQPRRVPGERHRAQRGPLVRRLLRRARRQALPPARSARARLVSGPGERPGRVAAHRLRDHA